MRLFSLLKTMATTSSNIISCVDPLSFPFKTPDPFLFCVYHKDAYPAGDSLMQAPRRGNGADFNPSAPYRMYHGDRIPGFPQHPHRGFETMTATIDGLIDHSDSLGNAGRYGHGDLQWMTAGKGVVHGEMFPLINDKTPNHTKFFQIWLNLPAKSKMVDPAFVMHWAEDVPKVTPSPGVSVTVWAGEVGGARGLPPPPNSYATDPASDLAVLHITLQPGATFTMDAARGGASTNRMAYFIEGSSLVVEGGGSGGAASSSSSSSRSGSASNGVLTDHVALTLRAQFQAIFRNTHPSEVAEVLVLQGRPIGEPVAQHGPFVMNTQAEIAQAFADYRKTQFGGWPWPQDAMVFPRDKGRFSLSGGVEERPPGAGGAGTGADSLSGSDVCA